MVAPRRARHRRYKQLHQARTSWRKVVHHTVDGQRDARGGRNSVHVSGNQRADVEEHAQRRDAKRLP